ncbi:MAG: hypothetical protein P1U35_13350 [Cycloclasticus sp.]|nr:hypothetical protein [Cycloclasticus sp.]
MRKSMHKGRVDAVVILYVFLVICSFANVFAALAISLGGPAFSFLISIKDVFLLIFFLCVVAFKAKGRVLARVAFVSTTLIVLLLIYFLRGEQPVIAQVASIRQLILFFMLFTVGAAFGVSDKILLYKRISIVVNIGVIIVVVGFVERFTHLWSYFVRDYFLVKKIGVLSNGYPFVLIEPLAFINEFDDVFGFLRMSSSFLDPINFGHACVAWYFLADMVGRNKSKNFILLGLILSCSKAALLHFLVIFFVFKLNINLYIRSLLALFLVLIAFVVIQGHPGFISHMAGLTGGFQEITVLGNGLATAGNVAQMFGDGGNGIGDSFVGALMVQIGLFGSMFWVLAFVYLILMTYSKNKLMSVLMLVQLGLSLLSENSFNYLSIAVGAMMAGLIAASTKSDNLAACRGGSN